MGEGFECMGFGVYCDNCGRRHALPAADNLQQAKADALQRGLVFDEVNRRQFCNEGCRREHAGETCLHAYSRSDPGVCVKCGKTRDLS